MPLTWLSGDGGSVANSESRLRSPPYGMVQSGKLVSFLKGELPLGRFVIPTVAQYALVAQAIRGDSANSGKQDNSTSRRGQTDPVCSSAPAFIGGRPIYDFNRNLKVMTADSTGLPRLRINPQVGRFQSRRTYISAGCASLQAFNLFWRVGIDREWIAERSPTVGLRLFYETRRNVAVTRLMDWIEWAMAGQKTF